MCDTGPEEGSAEPGGLPAQRSAYLLRTSDASQDPP
jgi:hypothetical protein